MARDESIMLFFLAYYAFEQFPQFLPIMLKKLPKKLPIMLKPFLPKILTKQLNSTQSIYNYIATTALVVHHYRA